MLGACHSLDVPVPPAIPGRPAYRSGERLTHTFSATPTTAPYAHETARRIWAEHNLTPFDLFEEL
ncbi:hypothetical protein AB0I81_48655 [Nonomuraea sp. NPDC050404]|uniref:hypothetical protein n=1 Tax=Nonomuraea sp. NPDC050404 TaxID=3155783 RepID=UPI0033EB289C